MATPAVTAWDANGNPVASPAAASQAASPSISAPPSAWDETGKPVTAAPSPSSQEGLSRTNMNMSRAMSGQQMDSPEDQAQFEQGKKSGAINAGIDTATGAVLGPLGGAASDAIRPTLIKKVIGTGLMDASGKEITREVVEHGPSALAQTVKKLLPVAAKVEEAEKIARIIYHAGVGLGGATYLYHEIFGGK